MSPQKPDRYRLSPCLEWIFQQEHPDFLDRVRAAATAGTYGVEFHFWRSKPLDELKRLLGETGLVLTSMVVEPRVCLVAADQRRHEFLQALKDSVAAAVQVGARAVVVASGPLDATLDRRVQHNAMIEGLRLATPIVADQGVTLLLEPVNTLVDHPGVFLDGTVEGLDVIEQVAHPAVRLLYDIYHSYAMRENPADVLGNRVGLIGHVQAADLPGRNQPGSGQIPWSNVLQLLHERGYDGPIGLEYRPTAGSAESLAHSRRAFDP